MDRVRHPRLSAAEKAELWRRWKRGESVSAIGRALGRIQGTGYHAVSVRGGVPPAPRRRSRWALTLAEREAISRGVACQWSFRRIGAQLGRAPSTVSRQARRPKPCRLATVPRLRTLVAAKLAAAWFPQQIAGWLRRPFPSDPGLHVSHETIYLRLFVQSRGVLRRELRTHLCQRRRMRRAKRAHSTGQRRGQIVDAVSIRERPAAAEDRAVPGQWEGDLLCGARNSHIATLVERHARFVLLVRLAGKDTRTVVQALPTAVRALPTGLMASPTWDRGMELASHQRFTVATHVQVYFCDPQSPWPRGSNENTNGLLRQYLPRGTDLAPYTQADLDAIAQRLNTRPRKTLGYETPADRLAAPVASTG